MSDFTFNFSRFLTWLINIFFISLFSSAHRDRNGLRHEEADYPEEGDHLDGGEQRQTQRHPDDGHDR